MSNIAHLFVNGQAVAAANRVPVDATLGSGAVVSVDGLTIAGNDSYLIDGSGRLRVANPVTLFDANFISQLNGGRWATSTDGTGAVAQGSGSFATLTAPDSTAPDFAILQSRRYIGYQQNKSMVCVFNVKPCAAAPTAGDTEQIRVGFFDDDDGPFWQFTINGAAAIVDLDSGYGGDGGGSTTIGGPTLFNIDKLDGTGPSGVDLSTYNGTSIFTCWIEVNWAASTLTWGIVIDREWIACHRATVSLSKASFPVRASIYAGAAPGGIVTEFYGSSIVSEGGYSEKGLVFSHARDTLAAAAAGAETAVLALRADAGAAAASRVTYVPRSVSAVSTKGSRHVLYRVYRVISPADFDTNQYGGTAAVWVNDPSAGSYAEISETVAAFSPAAGSTQYQLIATFFDSDNEVAGRDDLQVALTADIAGTSDILVITAEPIGGGAQGEEVYAAITWEEIE